MRKFTLLFSAILMASFAATATNMAGTYKVGSAVGANFALLSSAIDSLNVATITGDVVLEITSDITEPTNFGLAKDMGTFKLTIRPDADANRTVTFSQALGNVSPYGHFVIGYPTAGLALAYADASVIATNNVTIDGYAVGGSTKRLKFTTTTDALVGSVLISIVGGCTGTTIQNCILDNVSTGSNPRCIYLIQYMGSALVSPLDVSPINTLIQNNDIIAVPSLATVNGIGIQFTKSGTPLTRITNTTIKGNSFLTRGTSLEVYYANGANIIGNEFKIRKGTATGISYSVYLRGSAGDMNVIGNKFTEFTTSQAASTGGTWGVFDACTGTNAFNLNVYNNTFSGMNRSATGATAINQCYIASGQNTLTTKISHNTFYLPVLSAPTQAGYYNAIKYTTTTRKPDVTNNIFISNEDSKSCFISDANTAGTLNNNIYYLRAGNTNARIVGTYATLSAYQTANATYDVNSKSVDVNFVDAAVGDLKIAGASVKDGNLAVPRLANVLTDLLGTTRADVTYAGAYEGLLPFNAVALDQALTELGFQIRSTVSGLEVKLNKQTTVELYTINGILLDKSIADGNYSRSLNKGVYIVRLNGKAVKFVK